jgi:hypothetical protein
MKEFTKEKRLIKDLKNKFDVMKKTFRTRFNNEIFPNLPEPERATTEVEFKEAFEKASKDYSKINVENIEKYNNNQLEIYWMKIYEKLMNKQFKDENEFGIEIKMKKVELFVENLENKEKLVKEFLKNKPIDFIRKNFKNLDVITQTLELQAKIKRIEDEHVALMSTLNLNNEQKAKVNTKLIENYWNQSNIKAIEDVNNEWRDECRRKLIGSVEEINREISWFLKNKSKKFVISQMR